MKQIKSKPVIIEVDFTKTIEQMVAAGNYDSANTDFLNEARSSQTGTARYELCHFDISLAFGWGWIPKVIKTDDLVNPWAPAELWPLLAYGVAMPDEQLKFDIFGLGTKVRRSKSLDEIVPYLGSVKKHGGGTQRLLSGYELGDRYFDSPRWLASRLVQ